MNINNLIDIKEVEKQLNLSSFQVKKLIIEGKLIAVNADSWRIDGKFLFDSKEVEKLKEEVQTEGITLGQAVKQFNVSLHTLKKLIEENTLEYKEFMYRGRNTIFVDPEDVEIILSYDQHERIYSYSRKQNVILFQKLIQGNTVARVTKIQKRGEITVTDEFGNEFSLEEAYKRGYKLAYELTKQPRSNHKGFVTFRFPYSKDWRRNSFKDLDMLLQHVSPSNVHFEKEDTWLIARVRHSLVEMNTQDQQEFLGTLETYVIEGKISARMGGGVFIDSNSFTKNIMLSEKQYQRIQDISAKEGLSMEVWISNAIEEKLAKIPSL